MNKMHPCTSIIALLLAVLLACTPAFAAKPDSPPGKDKEKKSEKVLDSDQHSDSSSHSKGGKESHYGGSNVSVNILIGDHDRDVIRNYYHGEFSRGHCPPGLAKKKNGCMPPGQYKKLYGVGQRWPLGYGRAWTYNQIPYDMRTHYGFDPRYNYYYGDGYLYRVDPATMLISQVVSAILR